MLGHREKMIYPDEYDLTTGWRRLLCCFQRAGETKKVKKRMTRRNRRKEKIEAKAEIYKEHSSLSKYCSTCHREEVETGYINDCND
jgi:hypothetical protein